MRDVVSMDRAEHLWRQIAMGEKPAPSLVPQFAGRIDLRGLELAKPKIESTVHTDFADLSVLKGLHEVRGRNLRSVDFSGSTMPGLRLHDCSVQDCRFEKAVLRDFRVWNSAFADVSFRGANLKSAVLGPSKDGRRNEYRNVDFSEADLRDTVYQSARFVDCQFEHSKLFKVEFNGSAFEGCVFVGDLREVMFFRTAFRVEDVSPNQMRNVDFAAARLSWCDFRQLDLDTVIFPQDDDHIVMQNFPEVLDQILQIYGSRDEIEWRGLCVQARHNQKWLGEKQKRGYFNVDDLAEVISDANMPELMEFIAKVADLERPVRMPG